MEKRILEIMKKAGIQKSALCEFRIVSERLLECRAKKRIPKNAKTVIMCAFPYKVKKEKPEFLSRYAAVPDYHTIVGKYLSRAAEMLKTEYPLNVFECFTDNSPVPEVFAAASAGLGVRGDNGLLITPEYGSWVFLGEIITDIEAVCKNRYSECPHCGACLRACPKQKLGTDCLSAVSQKKRELSENEKQALKEFGIMWGCDICAEVCPLNRKVKISPLPEFSEGYRNKFICNEDITERAFAWRGEKVINRNYFIIKGDSENFPEK